VLEAHQRRIDSAVVELQGAAADLFDAAGDAEPVLRPHRLERLENHQRQRALQEVRLLVHCSPIGFQQERSRTPIDCQ
jgi:hypothetical protein